MVRTIVRDYMWQVCAASCQAMGAICDLEFSRDLRIQNILLEWDSKQVVQAITASGLQWCSFGQIIEDIHAIFPGSRRWQVKYVKR